MYPLPTLLLAVWCTAAPAEPLQGKRFEFRNPEELRQFFKANRYDIPTWSSGDRTVPRLYLHHIPPGSVSWRGATA
jgi:hypothetical protein